MTPRLMLIFAVVLALAPFVAIAAGSAQRQTQGSQRELAEFVAVVALTLTLDASILAVWGATYAAQVVQFSTFFHVLFGLLQLGIPFFCYFKLVRPSRVPLVIRKPTAF